MMASTLSTPNITDNSTITQYYQYTDSTTSVDDDHHDEDHDEEEGLIEKLSSWNVAVSTILIVLMILVGLPSTMFELYAIRRTRKTPSLVLMIATLCYHLVALVCLLPLTLAGILNLAAVTEMYCYIQEPLTFVFILSGFFHPALLSLIKFDTVVNYRRKYISIKVTILLLILLTILAACIALIPIFGLTTGGSSVHEHGCHLWSTRIDEAVWYVVAAIGLCLCLSVFIMFYSYLRIYLQAKKSVGNLAAHTQQRNTVALASVSANNESTDGETAMHASDVQSSTSDPTNSKPTKNVVSHHNKAHKRKTVQRADKRVRLIATVIILMYLVFWSPWLAVNIIVIQHAEELAELRILTMVIGFIPSATDPIALGFMSPPVINQFNNLRRRFRK